MKSLIFSLIALLCFANTTKTVAQCLQQTQTSKLSTYKSTGVNALDNLLNTEKSFLEEVFKVKTELKILNDKESPNAFASEESSNTFFFDGSVYLGYELMSNELSKTDGISAVRGIMAHEYAHVLQSKLDSKLEGSIRELHADFLAGWYMGVRSVFADQTSLEAFAVSLFEKGDSELWEESHHGTPKQRLKAMLGGYLASSAVTDPKKAYYIGIELLTNGGNNGEIVTDSSPDPSVLSGVTVTSKGIRYDKIYSIEFTADNVPYYGLMMLKGNVGKLRLKFNNSIVEQDIAWQDLEKGGGYFGGSNPIDPTTNKPIKYNADNFVLVDTQWWNIDDAGNKTKVTTGQITDVDKANEWLAYLKW